MVVVKRTQLTKLVYEHNQGANISMSAMKAGMSRKTGRKYLRQDNVLEQRQAVRQEGHGGCGRGIPHPGAVLGRHAGRVGRQLL